MSKHRPGARADPKGLSGVRIAASTAACQVAHIGSSPIPRSIFTAEAENPVFILMPRKMPPKGTPEYIEHRRVVNTYSRLWDAKNGHRRRDINNAWKVEKRKKYRVIKQSFKCVFCGESEVGCLDFHHLDSSTKEFVISVAAADGFGMPRLLSEIKKCVSLCKNCHVKVHLGKLIVSDKEIVAFRKMLDAGMAELDYAPHS